MKKFLNVLLILAVVGGLAYGGYYWYENYYEAGGGVAQTLPSGAIVYYKENNAAESFNKLAQTEFWRKISKIDLQKLMAKSDVGEQDQMMFELIKSRLTILPESLELKRYFGSEFAVAVYPVKIESYTQDSLIDLAGGMTFVTKLAAEDKFIDFFKLAFQQVGQEYVSRTVPYKDYDVTTVTVPQLGISKLKIVFVRVGNYVVFGLGERSAHSAIDVATQAKPSLVGDANYQTAKASFQSGAQSVSYINMEAFLKEVNSTVTTMATTSADMNPQQRAEFQRSIDKSFEAMKGFKAVGASSVYEDMVRLRSDYYYDPNGLMPNVRELYNCSPKDNQTLRFTPRDVLVYQWSDCYDLKYYWDEITAEMANETASAEGPSLEMAITGAESFLGLSIENELIPALGKEQGWVLSSIDTSAGFPLPKFTVFIKVLDQPTLEKVLAKVSEQPFLFVQSEDYKNHLIKSVTLPIGATLQPGYTFIDGYFIFSSSVDLLKDSINARDDRKLSLVSDPSFNEMKINLTDKSNGVFFLKLNELMQQISGAVDWGADWYLAKNRQMEAYHSGSQQRLTDINDQMQLMVNQLETQNEKLRLLDEEKSNSQAQGADTGSIEVSINEIKDDVGRIQKSLTELQAKQQELESIVETLGADETMDSNILQLYLDEGVKPVLDAIGSIKLIGTKVTMKDSVIETISAIKVQ